MVYFRMGLAIVTPVLFANLFYFLDLKTPFQKLSARAKQIVIGVVFGIIACLATQFGVPYDRFMLNVRSAAPLTAGLIFGGPAGIIAGAIGAVYRWVSVYWGVPTYTKVACSVATLLAGLIAALCRKYMFNGKKTSWFYGVFIAIVTEIFHMLLVFLTHMDDIYTAFDIVKTTAVLMILCNAASLFLSMLFISVVSKEQFRKKKYTRPITQTFSAYLLVSVLVAFFATSLFTFILQKNVGDADVENLLSMNIEDVKNDIQDATDRDLLNRTKKIAQSIQTLPSFSMGRYTEAQRSILVQYCGLNSVTEINIVGEDGVILLSSDPTFDGFDMKSNPDGQAIEFMCLLNGTKSYVQSYGPTDLNPEVYRKYAGVAMKNGIFLQVGYDKEHFQQSVRESIENVAANRHVGQNGFLFIISPSEESPLISAPEHTVTQENIIDFASQIAALPNDEILEYETAEGESFYYMKETVEGYVVVGCIPVSEAEFERDISVYIGAFMQFVVFFILFLQVFFLIKNRIVDNIHKINASLARITNGDLSTRVDIDENEEFASLSHDINCTVSRLKEYIAEAEKRIDQELAFAQSIQHSTLPSVFPPYPERDEFDIYASMHTAKEVGGDFYDFYLLGRDRLAFLIADVSGKGIPAAMFMMRAKTMLKSYAESGLSVEEIFNVTNEKLCEANEAGMFVTAWMGILDLKTGTVQFVNAGHNPPLVKHKDGGFEYFKTRPGLVLAGMEGMKYHEGELKLLPGDEIFLYTDGVTEATNVNTELFGEGRLQGTLNEKESATAAERCADVKNAVDSFVDAAPQFDDITMLSLRFIKNKEEGNK